MSLGETQAIFYELERIVALLERADTTSVAMQRRLPETTAMVITVQQTLRLLWRMSSLLRKMGLSEDQEEVVRQLTQIARYASYAYYAINLLNVGTPYGVVAGVIGLINVGIFGGYDLLRGTV
jgi:hypothetical protein